MDMLLNFLQFYRTMVGISTPLIDKSGKIIAYQLLKYKKDEEMIIKKTKLSVLADLTIKAETRSLSIELIKWLTDYTQIEKLDNYIESKLTKDKIWHYLDSENNIESFINYLQKVSSNPIPNNVIEIIRSWESKYGFVQVVEGVTIILPVPGIIDSMLSLKSFSKFKIIKINENTIIVPAKDLKKFTTFLAKKNYHIKKNIL